MWVRGRRKCVRVWVSLCMCVCVCVTFLYKFSYDVVEKVKSPKWKTNNKHCGIFLFQTENAKCSLWPLEIVKKSNFIKNGITLNEPQAEYQPCEARTEAAVRIRLDTPLVRYRCFELVSNQQLKFWSSHPIPWCKDRFGTRNYTIPLFTRKSRLLWKTQKTCWYFGQHI